MTEDPSFITHHPSFKKTTILIVEDEVIVASDLSRKLERLGYEVCGTAMDGEEAVALAGSLRPHLVLMDIRLEGSTDGIEAARAICRNLDVPIVYLTAHPDTATLERAKLTEPFGYILKPFEERELATQIELALYKHQADRRIREQAEWLRVTLTSIGDAVITCDTGSRITFLNPIAATLTGWSAEEAIGQPIPRVFCLVSEQTGQAMEEPVARVLREGRTIPLANHAALVTKDGRNVPIEDSAAPILDAAGRVIGAVLVFHDVTERRRAEEELRKSRDELELRVRERTEELHRTMEALRVERQQFNDVLDVLPVYVMLLTPDYRVPFANNVFRQRFGEPRGLRCFEHLFDRAEPCEICETYTVLKTMKPHHWEWTGPDGCIYDVFDFPFTDTDGSTLILEMGIDITHRKKAEEKLASYMARIEQSNQALQDFASIASHDMQEPLRKVTTFGNILRQKHKEALGETGNDYLDRMLGATGRMQTLLTSLLEYSRVTTKQEPFLEVDLYDIVHEVLSDLELRIAATGGEVQVGKLPCVEADPTQMRQLFQNLIGNALKFHRHEEKPLIKVQCTASDGSSFRIIVEDNGIGFNERYMDRIFSPFQRLHGKNSQYEGTGMGLAICKKIVERHGGAIEAQSKPGEGSTFIVTLPMKRQ